MLTVAKRSSFSRPAIRSWQDACVFARPATSPESRGDSRGALEHGDGPGG